MLPNFLMVCTQPASVTVLPASEILNSPQLFVLYILFSFIYKSCKGNSKQRSFPVLYQGKTAVARQSVVLNKRIQSIRPPHLYSSLNDTTNYNLCAPAISNSRPFVLFPDGLSGAALPVQTAPLFFLTII